MASKALQSSQRWLESDSVTKSVLLGEGRYATVWLGRFQGKSCVVKVPRKDVTKPLDKDLKIFTLEGLSHPNLVHVMGIWEDPSELGSLPCVVMENCEMSLPEYLRANKSALKRSHGSTSATEIKIRILLDVVRGLVFLHQKAVFHGDLRSSNLLVQRESTEPGFPLVKISDYGFTQRVDEHNIVQRCEILCDEDFLPPEMVGDHSGSHRNAILTSQVDVFMFGDVALETVTLDPVLRARKAPETKHNTEVDRRAESFQKIVQLGDKDVFTSLITLCLAEKPEDRMRTSDIMGVLQTHLSYYKGHPYANALQDKTAECERLRAENKTEWKRVQELQRQLKAFHDSKKQMKKKQFGAIESVKEGQTQAESEGFIIAQLTDGIMEDSNEVSALTVERHALQKQVHKLETKMKESKEQIQHRDTAVAKLQKQVDRLKAETDRLLQAASGWTEEKRALNEQLQAKQDEFSKLKQSNDTLLKKMTTFRDMLHDQKQVVADLRSAVALGKDCVMTQFEALQKDVKVVKKKFQCVVLEKERASVVAMQVLEDQFKDKFESDTAGLSERVGSLTQDKTALMGNLQQAQDELKEAKQGYDESQLKVTQHGKTINAQTARITELDTQLHEAKSGEATYMRDIAKKTTEMAQLKEEQEKVEIKHEKAFQKAIDTLTDYHRAAFIIKVDPPLIDTQAILSALKSRLNAKWRDFGIFLGVNDYTMDVIAADYSGASDRMSHLVSQWIDKHSGTGAQARTWETVVKAVNGTGSGIAQELATTYGIDLI